VQRLPELVVPRRRSCRYIGGRRLDRWKELAAELSSVTSAAKVHACQVDVTSRDEMEAFCQDCESSLGGRPDGCIRFQCGRASCVTTVHDWRHCTRINDDGSTRKCVDVNTIKGLLRATACILLGMLSRTSGHVVVTSSDAAGRKSRCGSRQLL
jgi:NADP-dependent 3-hydroxy acid dehydrogenase YdfG